MFCYTSRGDREFLCDEEWGELPARARWHKREQVTKPGVPLQANGQEAVDWHLAKFTATDFGELARRYGLEGDLATLEPTWADTLVDALKSPGVAVILLIVAFVGLYVELHAPGTGVGAFVAAVCFVMFFWSRYLGGTAGWLEVLLFLSGISCLALEVFVLPGFGIFGLGGGAWSWPR